MFFPVVVGLGPTSLPSVVSFFLPRELSAIFNTMILVYTYKTFSSKLNLRKLKLYKHGKYPEYPPVD